MAKNKSPDNNKMIVENRRARYDYAVEDVLECGLILMGSEVKALRIGSANIAESLGQIHSRVNLFFRIIKFFKTTIIFSQFGH